MAKPKPQTLHRCYHQDPALGMCKKCAPLIPIFDRWRYRLRLMDWDIILWVRDAGAMRRDPGKPSFAGLADVSVPHKSAVIEIRDDRGVAKCEPASDAYGLDTEATIVHELLHVHFEWMREISPRIGEFGSMEGTMFERMIETFAKSLVDMDRGVR